MEIERPRVPFNSSVRVKPLRRRRKNAYWEEARKTFTLQIKKVCRRELRSWQGRPGSTQATRPCGKHFEHNQQVRSSHPCWEDCLLGPWPSYMMHPLFFSLTPFCRDTVSMVNGQPCMPHWATLFQAQWKCETISYIYITVCRNVKILGALRSQGAVLLETIAIFLPCGQLRLAITRLKLKKNTGRVLEHFVRVGLPTMYALKCVRQVQTYNPHCSSSCGSFIH